MIEPIKLMVAGTGNPHVPHYLNGTGRDVRLARFVAVSDEDPGRLEQARRLCAQRPGMTFHADYREMFDAHPDADAVMIGSDNIFREGCTIHTGTKPDSETVIGNHCMFMNATHVAHNCRIGNNVIFVGFSGCAGYCEVFDNVLLSALSGMHQFCRIGRFAIISGGSVFSQDVPPFMMAEGRNGGVKMINKIGLQRAGFSSETITIIKHLYRIYYRSGLIPSNALAKIKEELPQIPEVLEFIQFCESSKRGVLPPHKEGHRN